VPATASLDVDPLDRNIIDGEDLIFTEEGHCILP
jgi:hypothetical protein